MRLASAICAIVSVALFNAPALHSGGNTVQCALLHGVVTSPESTDVADPARPNRRPSVVFVDADSQRVYTVDKIEIVRKHLGHPITIKAHASRSRPTSLVVHYIRCAEPHTED